MRVSRVVSNSDDAKARTGPRHRLTGKGLHPCRIGRRIGKALQISPDETRKGFPNPLQGDPHDAHARPGARPWRVLGPGWVGAVSRMDVQKFAVVAQWQSSAFVKRWSGVRVPSSAPIRRRFGARRSSRVTESRPIGAPAPEANQLVGVGHSPSKQIRRHSSAVEQWFCKPEVACSIQAAGSTGAGGSVSRAGLGISWCDPSNLLWIFDRMAQW